MTDLLPPAVKDENRAHPLAGEWRPVFKDIVHALVEGDYSLSRQVPHVRPVSSETARQITEYLADYGATLAELPDESWESSVSQWEGEQWDVLVDMWTLEEGGSDLVLGARVYQTGNDLEIEVGLLYVP
jgi:hypothetical protein